MSDRIISQHFKDETVVLRDYAGCRFVDCTFEDCLILGPGTLECSKPHLGVTFGYFAKDKPIIPVIGETSMIRCTLDGVTFDPETWAALQREAPSE